MSLYKFSSRTNWEFTQNKLTLLIDEFKNKNMPFVNLIQSNPTECGFDYDEKRTLAGFQNKENLIYRAQSKGIRSAREAICDFYKKRKISVSPEQIVLTSSTSEAYTYLFRLLANPKDQILFPQPSYPLFQFLCDLNDVELNYYGLSYNQGWLIDENDLKDKITKKTKALTIVNPNNPTGSYISIGQKQKINQFCQEYQMAVISDEVFFDFCLDEKSHTQETFIGNSGVLSFTLGGLSKALGMPQMKLSWIIVDGPKEQKKQALERLEMIADTYLSVNTPVQNALAQWLTHEDFWQSQIKQRLKENLRCICQAFEKIDGASIFDVQGGWSVVIKLEGISDDEQFVLNLLSSDGVLIYPGYFFDFKEEGVFVISLLPLVSDFAKGIDVLSKRYVLAIS